MRILNFRPNSMARSLRMGVTKTYGLVVPDIANPFFAEIGRKIENFCYQNGYNVILCNSDDNQARESSYIELLISKMVDGVIFIAAGDRADNLTQLVDAEIPVVIVDRDFPQSIADVILVDNAQGGYLATEYLIKLGHYRIACISGASQVTPSADRVRGYRQALMDYRLPVDEEFIVSGYLRYEGGIKAMEQLLQHPRPPTAVFCCNDVMAVGALRTLRNHGFRVPEDVSLVGFDDIFLASAVTPALTTIAQPVDEIAQKAAELLLSRTKSNEPTRNVNRYVFSTRLVIRDSCCRIMSSIREEE